MASTAPTAPLADDLDTLPKRLLHNAANWPGDVAMREKELGIWRVYSWADCRDQVRLRCARAEGAGLSAAAKSWP